MSMYRKWMWRLFLSGALVSMIFVVACGTAEQVAEQPAQQPAAAPAASQQQAAPAQQAAPSAPSQPAAQQQAAPASSTGDSSAASEAPAAQPAAAQAVPTPTIVAAAALASTADGTMGPSEAPAFADYWKPPTAYYGDPVYGGTLRINYEDPLEHANVWGARSGTTIRYRVPTHDTLIQDNPYDPGAPFIPGLAYGWTVDDDLKGVTFYLKDNVMWHNGEPMTCEDARYSYEIMITEEGITGSYMKNRLSEVDLNALQCVDDSALKFRFTVPSAVPLLNFGNPAAMIFNKAWFLEGGEEAMFQDVTVGTGPFTWDEGQQVGVDEQHFSRNPNYHVEGLPYIYNLVIFGILDESAQQAAMLAHQTDWHWIRNFGQYDQYVKHDQIQTVIRATRSSENLWINTRNEPFDNVRIRQAIAMGFDKVTGIKVTLSGYGSVGLGLMPPGSPWAVTEEQGCGVPGWCPPADMEAQRADAIQILNEEGFDFDKTYVLTVESDNQRVVRATYMQEQLRLLGIKTDFDVIETIAYRKSRQAGTWGDFMASTGGVSGVDDPYLGLGPTYRCESLFNFQTPGTECNASTEAKFEELGKMTAFEERKALGQEIQVELMGLYYNFPSFWEQEGVAFWPEVRGYVHYPGPTSSHLRWAHMWIDPNHYNDKGFSGQTQGVPGGE